MSEKSILLDAHGLLRELFPDESSRPTVRWLRSMQAKNAVPYKKIARRVFFDPSEVKSFFDNNFTVAANLGGSGTENQ
jgi:hypothetical protein